MDLLVHGKTMNRMPLERNSVSLVALTRNGEPNVHQDQARVSLLGEADALFPRLGLDDLVALERQHVSDKLAVLVVVLHDEDQFIRHGAPGS